MAGFGRKQRGSLTVVGEMKTRLFAVAAMAALLGASSASAAVAIYDFKVVDSASGLGSTPTNFGSVTVTEDAGDLIFAYTPLADVFRIHQGNDNHDAFAFNLAGNPSVTIGSLSANFARKAGAGPFSEPPMGSYSYAITYAGRPDVPGKGYADGGSSLTFRVDAGATVLTIASLTSQVVSVGGSNYNVFFSSDVVNTGGLTGNVGALLRAGVPEPATWAMMIGGFGMAGTMLRRRRQLSIRA